MASTYPLISYLMTHSPAADAADRMMLLVLAEKLRLPDPTGQGAEAKAEYATRARTGEGIGPDAQTWKRHRNGGGFVSLTDLGREVYGPATHASTAKNKATRITRRLAGETNTSGAAYYPPLAYQVAGGRVQTDDGTWVQRRPIFALALPTRSVLIRVPRTAEEAARWEADGQIVSWTPDLAWQAAHGLHVDLVVAERLAETPDADPATVRAAAEAEVAAYLAAARAERERYAGAALAAEQHAREKAAAKAVDRKPVAPAEPAMPAAPSSSVEDEWWMHAEPPAEEAEEAEEEPCDTDGWLGGGTVALGSAVEDLTAGADGRPATPMAPTVTEGHLGLLPGPAPATAGPEVIEVIDLLVAERADMRLMSLLGDLGQEGWTLAEMRVALRLLAEEQTAVTWQTIHAVRPRVLADAVAVGADDCR